MVKRLNLWFDRLPNGERFLVFFAGICMPMALLLAFYPPVGLIFAVLMILMRVWHFHWS